MPEAIYIATSPQYEGIVKIGRTDRPVQERIDELSREDYGLEGEINDTEWELSNVIFVDDNVASEALIHDHFESIRVSDSRELFYSTDPDALASEAASVSGGVFDLSEVEPDVAFEVLDQLIQLGLVAGVGVIAGRLLHKRFKGHPRYEKFLIQASQRSTAAKHMASEAAKDARERWAATEAKRSELYEASVSSANSALNSGREHWESTEPLRAEITEKAREGSKEVQRGFTALSKWARSKMPKRSKK